MRRKNGPKLKVSLLKGGNQRSWVGAGMWRGWEGAEAGLGVPLDPQAADPVWFAANKGRIAPDSQALGKRVLPFSSQVTAVILKVRMTWSQRQAVSNVRPGARAGGLPAACTCLFPQHHLPAPFFPWIRPLAWPVSPCWMIWAPDSRRKEVGGASRGRQVSGRSRSGGAGCR